MQGIFGAVTVILMMGIVIARVQILKRRGLEVMHFGKLDKTDFLIPPFAFFYFYTIFANAFNLPNISTQVYFTSALISWGGVLLCLLGLLLLLWSLVSFGRSFRIGIDVDRPEKLITTGAFAVSRNPIYVAFAGILLGQFLIFPNLVPLIYLLAALWLLHRQVLREEAFLREHYGEDFQAYCRQVRRYL